MPEPMDFAEFAQQCRDEGAEEWVIWLAETLPKRSRRK